MARDPRDILVSHYWHRHLREKDFDGSMSEFVRHPVWGIDRLLHFYGRWSAYLEGTPSKIVIKYEDLHKDPSKELQQLFDLINCPMSKPSIESAVEYGQLQNLKKLSASKLGHVKRIRATDSDNAESAKIRKGKIGGYTDYLSVEDINFINEKMQKSPNDIFGYR